MKIQMNKNRILEEFSGLENLSDHFHNGYETIKDKLSPTIDSNGGSGYVPFAGHPLVTKENNPFRKVFK
jgi:hypothetical protein